MMNRTPASLVVLLTLAASAAPAAAATPLDSLAASPDTTAELGGVLVRDHELAVDDLVGGITVLALGGLPVAADIDAVHPVAGGEVLFSLDSTAEIGGTVYGPADIVRYDGIAYTLEFDGSAAGLPAGVVVDAVSDDGTGLLLSFDTTVELAGGPYSDEDLVRWTGAGFESFFDGSAAGVDKALDVDGAHWLDTGNLLLSFDGSGTVGGVAFDDEDVLEYDPVAVSWVLAYDGSAGHAGWVAADLDALAAVAPGLWSEPLVCSGNTVEFSLGPPADWAAVDSEGTGLVWTGLAGCGEAGNYTNGSGNCACASSEIFGTADYDTEMWSPPFDTTGQLIVHLSFTANYQNFANEDFLDVDVSTDGGSSWTTVLSWNEDHGTFRGAPGEDVLIDISSVAANQPGVILRWHYYNPNDDDWDWYAQVDDASLFCDIPVTLESFTIE